MSYLDYGSGNNSGERNTEPSISLGGMRGQRYPNQFFDLAQQYMPPTIKELFRWCTFYFYNSPLLGATIKKISRYPITDLILEDEHESVRDIWDVVFNRNLKIKTRHMEINLDYHGYGNAFVSIHLPFTRMLICQECGYRQPIQQWSWAFRGSSFHFSGKCDKCGHDGEVKVKDVPYKDLKGVRIVRWNPEFMNIKFNEYTGRYVYMYSVPGKLRNAVMRGDKDILEDIPLIVIDAIKKRRMIRFHPDSIFHLKAPTLAEQDQGWGKPAIIHVLKDMYYLYTLRRAQEAIALEHIVPFDLIYPMPNAQQDPFVHTDLANWRLQIEETIKRHRRDPNFKAVIPIPVGFGRLGGDGKALLLSPELNYLTQTIVGGMGYPSEMIFGGMNWTGSSVSLRMLENDFIQNRTDLLDLTYWIKDKIRAWFNLPNISSMRFADFRMADDIQKNQQLIGMNAAGKVSDQTLLTELGYDYEQEVKKRIEEIFVQNYLNDLLSKGSAKSQGEAQVITFNYQQKINEIAAKAQQGAMGQIAGMQQPGGPLEGQAQPTDQQMGPQQPGQMPGQQPQMGPTEDELQAHVQRWANSLAKMQPAEAQQRLRELKARMPQLGQAVEAAMGQAQAAPAGPGNGQNSATGVEPNMAPMPERGAPRRAGVL